MDKWPGRQNGGNDCYRAEYREIYLWSQYQTGRGFSNDEPYKSCLPPLLDAKKLCIKCVGLDYSDSTQALSLSPGLPTMQLWHSHQKELSEGHKSETHCETKSSMAPDGYKINLLMVPRLLG